MEQKRSLMLTKTRTFKNEAPALTCDSQDYFASSFFSMPEAFEFSGSRSNDFR